MSDELNTKIAKNTLFLYVRMFIAMPIGLYTSRVVLNVLGISDFGVYNLVGGIITMVSFLNIAMIQASQRFLSFELGRGNVERLKRVFCTSVNIHFSISLIAIVIGETIGLWFVNYKLNIPDGRMMAANWVYQASILTFVIGVMSVPYNSSIVAHERMSAFAYIGIFEILLKLIIVFLLVIIPFDKLIIYSILMVCVSAGIRLCYTFYCKKHFRECNYHFIFDKKLSSEMFSFAGWSLLGNMGFSFKDQISNIILNLFFGTSINAARGIGIQVATLVNNFSNNFTMAINPQITKQYALGNLQESRRLVYVGCRYSFYLLSIITIPIILNVNYILYLWLGTIPEYTGFFVVFSLLTCLLYVISGSVTTAIQATGRLKWFQIGICIIMLSELPIAWFLLKLGYPPYSVMWPSLITYFISIIFRFYLIHLYVDGYYFSDYIFDVVLRCFFLFGISCCICYFVNEKFNNTIEELFTSSTISVIITSCIYFFLGTHVKERQVVVKKVIEVLNHKNKHNL